MRTQKRLKGPILPNRSESASADQVLNLLIQQKLAAALPMAYYMAARRGPDSLMNRLLPWNTILSPEILQSAIKELVALREVELMETRSLIFGRKDYRSCSTQG